MISKVFKGWSDDINATTQSATVKIDRPKYVAAVWEEDYTKLYLAVGWITVIAVASGVVLRKTRH